MYLEQLEIHGFKSFALPVRLVFNRQLTCIVGPNGSGKSNVADAIRWVLGEQSLKLLRGKKHDDVIFAGSDRKGRLSLAAIKLYLNNSEHRANIDYDQIIVERRVYRDGESEYLINNNKVRLFDVQLLLAQAHVGQKSYSIIGQGMIDSLLTYSASERKEFFDEATGVKQYQIKKNQAVHKLEQTEENLQQAELVLKELEPRLRTLTRQVKKLERKEILEQELHGLQTKYYSFQLGNLQKQLKSVSDKKAQAEEGLAKLERQQHEIQEQMETAENSSGRQEAFALLQQKLTSLQQEHNALVKEKILIEGQKDLDLIKKGQADQVFKTQRLSELKTRSSNLELKIAELEARVKQQRGQHDSLKHKTDAADKEYQRVEKLLLADNGGVDWPALQNEAKELNLAQQQLLKELEAITEPAGLDVFKAGMRSFVQRFKQWTERTLHRSQNDRGQALGQFRDITAQRDDLRQKLHAIVNRQSADEKELEVVSAALDETKTERRRLASDGGSLGAAGTITELERKISDKDKALVEIKNEIEGFNKSEEDKKRHLLEAQKKLRTLQYDFNIKNNEVTNLKVEIAKLETKQDDWQREIDAELPHFEQQEVPSLQIPETEERIDSLKKQLHVIGGIDEMTQAEYQEVHDKHSYLTQQTTDLRLAATSLVTLINDLDAHISKQFEQNFKNINGLFTKYFKKLFSGGRAALTLHIAKSDEAEEEAETAGSNEGTVAVEEGVPEKPKHRFKALDYTIEIQATPPGKKLSNLAMLSGGEKALSAIALICAIIANNPSPFVVLDEVDAALDEANSIRFAEIIDELSSQTQFITITHNRATMHQAKILYGVTMGEDGISRLLSVNFDQADKLSAS